MRSTSNTKSTPQCINSNTFQVGYYMSKRVSYTQQCKNWDRTASIMDVTIAASAPSSPESTISSFPVAMKEWLVTRSDDWDTAKSILKFTPLLVNQMCSDEQAPTIAFNCSIHIWWKSWTLLYTSHRLHVIHIFLLHWTCLSKHSMKIYIHYNFSIRL
jgi:hypothetical protein